MTKLSFILPCYNVSKYISRCLESIFACELPLDEYEVICVDDCSTDNTPKIICSYADRFANLQLIRHFENKASGGARNTGLLAAKGEFIWYIDPDDMIYPSYILNLLNSCLDNNLDILCFNYEDIDEHEQILSQPKVFNDTSVMNGTDFAKAYFGDELVFHLGYVVRFLYRRQFLLNNNLFFPEHTFWQDTVYMPHALLLAGRVQGSSLFVYRYWHHDTSVCGSFKKEYSGIKTYQWAFNAGFYVMNLAKDIQEFDPHYSTLFYNHACSHYINKFPLYLCRATASQRDKFYKQVKMHPDRVKVLWPHMNYISRLELIPIIGPICAHCLSTIYKLKHKFSN